ESDRLQGPKGGRGVQEDSGGIRDTSGEDERGRRRGVNPRASHGGAGLRRGRPGRVGAAGTGERSQAAEVVDGDPGKGGPRPLAAEGGAGGGGQGSGRPDEAGPAGGGDTTAAGVRALAVAGVAPGRPDRLAPARPAAAPRGLLGEPGVGDRASR